MKTAFTPDSTLHSAVARSAHRDSADVVARAIRPASRTRRLQVAVVKSAPADPGLSRACPLLASLVAFAVLCGVWVPPTAAQTAATGNAAAENAVGRGATDEPDGETTEPATEAFGIGELELDLDLDPLPDTPAPEGPAEQIDVTGATAAGGFLSEWLEPLRVSLKQELSYKFASPVRFVNNRSSIRAEYSRLFVGNLYLRLDTKLNLHWHNDHRAKAKDDGLFPEVVTREAYLQSSFWNTSVRLGYQILPWGISEGGAITDEVSPRNTSEFFFVSLEESRIGQPMLTADHFSRVGQWTGFFVPRPSYNEYPDQESEYDIPGAFDAPEPARRWDDPDDYEYGLRWQRTFGKSDVSLMAASLVDNDYVVRKQRFSMYGVTANVAVDNLLLRAEVALKKPKALFALTADGDGTTIAESDQLDASIGFTYSPGGRQLVYSAELVWNHLIDWQDRLLGRVENEYTLVGGISNRFLNDDLTVTWLGIFNRSYESFQPKLLTAYRLDDNSHVYFEVFYPYEGDERSGSWPYRDQKQFVTRYQFQF